MFGSLGNAFGSMKDKAFQASIRNLLNRKIENIGNITRLDIDSRQKTMDLELVLKGEPDAIQVRVSSYELLNRQDRLFIRLLGATASREWLTNALKEFVIGREFPVPDAAKLAL